MKKFFVFFLLTAVMFFLQKIESVNGQQNFFQKIGSVYEQRNLNQKLAELSQKVQALENIKKYKDAVPYAEELLKLKEQVESKRNFAFNLIGTLNTVGRINYKAGNIERATELYSKAIELGKNAPSAFKLNLKSSVKGLAKILIETNKKDEAEKTFIDAISSCEETFGKNNMNIMSLYADLGDFYLKNNKYNEAEKYYKKTLDAQKQQSDQGTANNSDFEKAVSAMSAISGLKKSMAGAQTTQDDKNSYVGEKVVKNLAFVYYKLGQYEKIKSLYFNDFSYLQVKFLTKDTSSAFGPTHPLIIPILSNFANLLGATDHKFAHELFVKISDLNNKMTESVFINFSADNMKTNYFKNSRIYAYSFISHTSQYAKTEESIVKDTFNMWAKHKGILVDFQSKLLYAVKISQDSKVKRKFNEYKKTNLELSRLSLTDENMLAGEYLNLKLKKMNLEGELSRLIAPHLKTNDFEVKTIIDALPKDSVYIDFAKIDMFDFRDQKFTEERYVAFIICPDENPVIRLVEIGAAKDIDSLVRDYHNVLELFLTSKEFSRSVTIVKKNRTETNNPVTYNGKLKHIGMNLYAKIMKPLVSQIRGKKKIIVSPDGELHLIPFEVFVQPNERYLLEDYTISYVTNARDIIKLKENIKTDATTVVIMADPDYNFGLNEKDNENNGDSVLLFRGNIAKDMKKLSFSRLSDTKDEADSIEKILKDKMKMIVRNYQDKKAVNDVLLNIKSPKILHLATHGFFLKDLKIELKTKDSILNEEDSEQVIFEDPMLKSGIALAGANIALQSSMDNGIFTSDKIVGLDLKDTELVVLSACSTGVGDVEKGDSVYGFKKAFSLAGAKSLIASLWSVPSSETTEIMVKFYTLLSEGKSKNEALREAKLEMMEKKNNPFYWGAFVLSGDSN